MDLRIAGKPFGLLTVEELQSLIPKLEAILRKPKNPKYTMRRFNSAYYSIQPIAELTMKPVIKTISEVKDAKEHLEDQISCLLMQFEKR